MPLKCLDTNRDIHLALLQIWSVLIGAGLPSPATMLFNRLIESLSPEMNRDPINVNNDNLYCEALETCLRKNDAVKDTQKDPPIFITGATVAVQWDDGGLWTYGVIVKPNNDDHRERWSYTTWVTMTDRLIMWNSKHICSINVTWGILCEQTKKSSEQLEDISVQTIPR